MVLAVKSMGNLGYSGPEQLFLGKIPRVIQGPRQDCLAEAVSTLRPKILQEGTVS